MHNKTHTVTDNIISQIGGDVVVTGAAGYIGECFVRSLIERTSNKIVGIDKNSINFTHHRFQYEHCDLAKADTIHRICEILGQCSNPSIFHFAGLFVKDIRLSFQVSPEEYYRNNVLATRNLVNGVLNLGLRPRLFIFTSTACVYDGAKHYPSPVEEAFPTVAYAQTKFDAEKEVHKLKVIVPRVLILRLSRIIGLGATPNVPRDIVSDFIERILDADLTKTYCDIDSSTEVRPYVHIDDLIDLLIRELMRNTATGVLIRNITPSAVTNVMDVAGASASALTFHGMLKREVKLEFPSYVETRVPVLNPMSYPEFQPGKVSSYNAVERAAKQYCRLLKELVEGRRFHDYLTALRTVRLEPILSSKIGRETSLSNSGIDSDS